MNMTIKSMFIWPYEHTFNGHIHFFPYKWSLINTIRPKNKFLIKRIEEKAADDELALLIKRIKAMRAAKSFPNVKTTDSVSQALIRIFGGYEGLEVFIQRLKNDYPVNLQTDMIRGELERLGSFGPIDEDVLRRIIEEV